MKIPLSKNARLLLERRYLKKNTRGEIIETPEELFRRVARVVASADRLFDSDAKVEQTEEAFFELMARLDFLPNSPTLMNAGRPLGQLSACFVLPIRDSIRSIFTALKQAAMIHQSGGGTGFSFSRLRPKGALVHTTHGRASGPVSFMEVFDCATEAIKQGGTRRGANMGVLRVDHPDILEFVRAKQHPNRLRNFNISVAVTDTFLQGVRQDAFFETRHPQNRRTGQRLSARDVFDAIVQAAWETGDPGLLFLDRVNRDNPTPQLGFIESTNPCGEQPLLPYESCNLGSINVSHFVRSGQVDFDRLRDVVRDAVHFLDNVIEVNRFPLPQIRKMTRGNRKIGLGVMGFADLLILLGIPYDSEGAVRLAEELMAFIQREAKNKSQELARQRGAFPNFKGSMYDRPDTKPIRNATRTTIAPTGSISILAGASSGIEPLFAPIFERHILEGEALLEVHPLFLKMARARGFDRKAVLAKVAQQGNLANIAEIPEDVRRIFRTAQEISAEWHINIQAAFQKFTDNAVSKTVNFPHDTSPSAIADAFWLAHELECKGITVYRDKSKPEQVLTAGIPKKEGGTETPENLQIEEGLRLLKGKVARKQTGCGKMQCLD